jgi:hypothetical protein
VGEAVLDGDALTEASAPGRACSELSQAVLELLVLGDVDGAAGVFASGGAEQA